MLDVMISKEKERQMTAGTSVPSPVQEAIDFGRSLSRVTVNHSSGDWAEELGFAEVDFLVEDPEGTEVGTTWSLDSSQWRLQLAGWRSSADSKKVHPLTGWDEVQAFLIERANADTLNGPRK